jgi:hypothetical protein
MTNPADMANEDNWTGGFYELSIELGPTDDARLDRALRALWESAAVEGCFAADHHEDSHAHEGATYMEAPLTRRALERHGHLRGVVGLPTGARVVCGVVAERFEGGHDWLDFYLPMSARAATDARIGGFPYGEEGDFPSLCWRQELDDWLAEIGRHIHSQVPFQLARIGFEASGDQVPSEFRFGHLMPCEDAVVYQAAEL